jgi:hypothetical protein
MKVLEEFRYLPNKVTVEEILVLQYDQKEIQSVQLRTVGSSNGTCHFCSGRA